MSDRRGFTVMELLVAVAITGAVLVLAHALLGGLVSARQRFVAAAQRQEIREAGDRWLDDIISCVTVGLSGDLPFDGDSTNARFSTRTWTTEGRVGRRAVHIQVAGGRLMLELAGAMPIVLRDSLDRVRFDYLLELGADSRWVSAWHSPVSAPLAIRLRVLTHGVSDTALYVIGARG